MIKKYWSLVLVIVVFEVVSAWIGNASQSGVGSWYAGLTPPPLSPPDFIFPAVWTILYALIAAAGWSVWRHRNYGLLAVFAVYMGLNWSWSFVFFNAQLLLAGFIWIIAINGFALLFILLAWPRVRAAALLMILPTLWTLFAGYLSGGYWWLNA